MIKTTLPMKQAVADIVLGYRRIQSRKGYPLSFRDFSAALTAVLDPFGGMISHQSVSNWERAIHLPGEFNLKLIAVYASQNWQKDFARDVLAVLNPEKYQPVTKLGEKALDRIEKENNPIAHGSSSGTSATA